MNNDACYRAIETRDRRFDGRLFVAVTTTGVYCRPFCPAPTPRRENCRFFPTAAAAQEAGFRPCLRCRPETSPEFAVWRGSFNTVSRALALMEAGALDEGGVEALAERLGIGGRQLRRLFRQHLGASPVAVAQTRRVLLAKQLIQDTRLPMVEVAAAAGFGSVRRFNETFGRLYRRPPGALRRARAAEESAAEAAAVVVRLGYQPPYDWDSIAAFLRAHAIPGVEVVSAGRYARTIATADGFGVVTVEPAPGNCLKASIRLPNLATLPAVVARVRRVFDLASDPWAIGAHLSQDPLLAPLVAARPGLRVPGAWDGFELAVRVVLGRYATQEAAARVTGRLAVAFGERGGEHIALGQGLTHAFSTPRQLAGADLAAAGVPESARASLSSLAAAAAAEPLIFDLCRGLEDAVARLRSLAGIDERTAHEIAMRELREPDAFPEVDFGPAGAGLRTHAERWRPWRAYAALHLLAAEPDAPHFPLEAPDDRQAA